MVVFHLGIEAFFQHFFRYFIFSCCATFDEDVVVPLTLSRLIPCVHKEEAK